jgi:formylglycine-generating enzyme required for sulfatase activity
LRVSAAVAVASLAVVLGGVGFALKAAQATSAARKALSEATRAEDNAHLAQAETAKVLRLSDVKRLQDLEAEAEQLWPPHPATIPALESWLQRARALLATREGHLATLQDMRRRARASSPSRRYGGRTKQPGETVAKAAARGVDQTQVTDMVQAEPEIPPPDAQVDGAPPPKWTFESTEEQWQHDVLAELVDDLAELESGLLGEDVTAEAFGWSVPKRLAHARELAAGFAPGGELARAWSDAFASIQRTVPGLDLAPQLGLVPLQRDAISGLWEFWHVLSGERPVRRADGSGWSIEPETGMVFVLIPAGSLVMGAQASDPSAPNYDPQASRFEGPVHERTVAAFFLSKYELTQAQWLRMTGNNPSQYPPGAPVGKSKVLTLPTHPVERVDWMSATATLARFGLELPTEAQWEYGARGGTTTAWWTGADKESLEGAANLADQAATRAGATWQDIADWPELDDGFPVHAPVDGFDPNPFGLHHVAGNVQELCADDWVSNWSAFADAGDEQATVDTKFVAFRGGNYGNKASNARSAYRGSMPKETSDFTTGVRPARPVE